MHANLHSNRNEWRLPPDETLQVPDPKSKKANIEDEEELVLPDDEKRNWWSIILSLLVIIFVISGIVAAIFLVGYVDELLYWHGQRMQLEQFLQDDLMPHRLPSKWISSTHFVYQNDDGNLMVLNTGNNFSVTILVTNHTLRQLNVEWYECSRNLQYVLFQHNSKQVYKKSSLSHYTIYDVSNDHHIPVRLEFSPKTQPELLELARWLGQTTALLIIFKNDIFLRPSPLNETEIRLTFDGQSNTVYNGIPDWLYQEIIFKSTDEALWTSPDSTRLLYATFNDTEVGSFNFPWFTASSPLSAATNSAKYASSFPQLKALHYPIPGSSIPSVKLQVLDLNNVSQPLTYNVHPPKALIDEDYYLTSANWIGQYNDRISVVWMNRAQNLTIISACFAPNWSCVETHAERALDKSWIDIQKHPVFSPDGDSFLLLAAVQEGSTEVYTHIKHVTVTQQHIAVLSHGRHEVAEILDWNANSHSIYYLGTEIHKPGQRHLYVVNDPSSDDFRRSVSQCITCDLSGVLWGSRYLYGNCTFFNAMINLGSTPAYYVLQCEGPGFPLAGVHEVTTHKLLRVLYDTRFQQIEILQKIALPKRKLLEIPLVQGIKAQVQLLLPPSWREELRDAAYPVIVEVNGQPGSKAVTEAFNIDWGTYISSHSDVVYVKLDVRGARGLYDHAVYRQIGEIEVEDHVNVLELLLDKLKFLDRTRVGVWGWGYGGYLTSMVMGLGNQQKVFRCGIAISPIIDWLYYNAAFTERILGLPSENYKGYVEADSTRRAKNIPQKSFYLIHSLADLSVPYQHGVSLARALTEAGVLFRYQMYTDEDHHLKGVLEHVYRSMQNFFEECLTLDITEQKENDNNS